MSLNVEFVAHLFNWIALNYIGVYNKVARECPNCSIVEDR